MLDRPPLLTDNSDMRPVLVIVTVLALSGCGGLTLDGREFDVATCSSGQVWGFVGVDLTDQEGRRIHVARTVGKEARVRVFEAPTRSVDLGSCGAIEVEVDEVPGEPYLVSGSLDVTCAGEGHTLEGGYRFSRCQ